MPSFASMAQALVAQAQEIDAYLEANNIPYPTFDNDTLDQLPPEMHRKRWDLADGAHDFRLLVRGALMSGWDIAYNWTDALMLRIIYHYNIPAAVPLSGSISYDALATALGMHRPLVYRVLQAAMANHIFDEDVDGNVVHTAISRLLATNSGFRDTIGLQVEELGPASSSQLAVWATHGQDTGEPNLSAFSMYNHTDKPMYLFLGDHPERSRRFGAAMRFFTSDESWDLRHMAKAYDWASLDKPGNRIVDIGGGFGQVSQYLAGLTSNLSFTVQDLPHVVASASAQLPDEFKSRIAFQAQDFLTLQPDDNPPTAFLVRWIFHNWSDKYSVKILKGLVPAMRKGSKVLIMEYVLDDKPAKKLSNKNGVQVDLVMAVIMNAQERHRWEFKRLLELSDNRFVLEGFHQPEGSAMSLVEVGWKG